ncbi:DUF1513 domain-containing protein [Pseudoprimorskyibacter insulae]|uniref:DUF1513 domain-containing protein n=1 Tax=Pseudoprimorskyibacter insulae TaxID=1695997 RepID=UPI000D551A09|nr:DUF1513 domain-containing protein [Pseudoprimorskyibacter insulae]
MTTRRTFLASVLASASLPSLTWAAAGSPSHLTAARDASGDYALYGLTEDGAIRFRVPLPDRGHAAAAHPTAPEAVAFARRPGRFALVIDCADGTVLHRLDSPDGMHFYGHGVFSLDGQTLFTTENHIATGEGRIGIWDRAAGYKRLGDFPSHGIGPHEIARIPGQEVLVVANGGILTNPDEGRDKLNLETMQPNLALLDENGTLQTLAEVPRDIHQNSLRHIAVAPDGLVACALQWQGDVFDSPPLMALYRADTGLQFVDMPDDILRQMSGYAGSVALLNAGEGIALTSPVGGTLTLFDRDGQVQTQTRHADICGVGRASFGGLATDGAGRVFRIADGAATPIARHGLSFDNHLIPIG